MNIYEGKTISYVDPKIDIEPFIPFAYDDEGGISIIFIQLIMNMKIKKIL